MAEIGKFNQLKIVKDLTFGVYLDGGELGEILMPRRYVPRDSKLDDTINAFIYVDSEDRLIATTETPLAQVGEFAVLRVVSINKVGAFMDWGLMKDLLVPYQEQKLKMVVGDWHVVRIYLDEQSKRIAATTKLNRYLNLVPPQYELNQEVELFITHQTDLGYNAIVNGAHWGIIYNNEVRSDLRKGLKIKGYVKKVREDGKIDLSTIVPGYEKIDDLSEQILKKLEKVGGYLPLGDKSDASDIESIFHTSKKSFKKAIGALFKKRLITVSDTEIRLV